MNIAQYLGTKKLNELILENPFDSAGKYDVTKGPSRFVGLLGSEFTFSEKQALKLSNTLIGTLYACTIKMVRVDPAFGTVLLTDIIVGRPLYWSDTKKFLVTPLASLTSRLAGISPVVMTSANNKGDIIPLVVAGDVGVKLGAALTKASPVINDPALIVIAANLAAADVIADATNWTNVQHASRMGRVIEAWNGGATLVKKMHLDNAHRIPDDGIKN